MVLGVLTILIIGSQAAYAGPPITNEWLFYGDPDTGDVDCKSGNNPCDVTGPPAVDGVSSNSNEGPTESYQNLVNALVDPSTLTAPLIHASCWNGAPTPAGDGTVTYDFGSLAAADIIQNQRANVDVGLGCEPAVTALTPELETMEVVVLDLTAIQDHSNCEYALSSNTDGETAFLWSSNQAPSGMVNLTPAEFLGADMSTDTYNDLLPFDEYLYMTGTVGDMLMQQIRCDVPVIGGTGIQIDTTALILGGAQTNAYWIIPIVVSATIIGIITIRRK
jgi:hypothetical protein